MKLSIAWIFDHILKKSFKDFNIPELVAQFNNVSAEVEELIHIKMNLDDFTLVKINQINDKGVVSQSSELNKEILLSLRKNLKAGEIYLVKKLNNKFEWATLQDLGSSKDGLLPSFDVKDEELEGGWKKDFEVEDYIITIDNKAVTHRPDMWGHRGFAREFAALMNEKIVPEEDLCDQKKWRFYEKKSRRSNENSFEIEVDNSGPCGEVCRRFSGLFFPSIENKSSTLYMATRLSRIDARPIDFIVDATNYVMFDFSQPMHAYDANKVKTKKILTRCAKDGEKLKLLDSDEVTLTSEDYVITDSEKPIGLAGVMGGISTAVSSSTTSLYLESANFDPTKIRRTAIRVKKRTEASARFEKSLDRNQTEYGILRFLKLLDNANIKYEAEDEISTVGSAIEESEIRVSLDLINKKIGKEILVQEVEDILLRLGFSVRTIYEKSGIEFLVTIPTYRGTKDISIEEDIVEEVARFIGLSNVPLELPKRQMKAFDTSFVMRLRAIKKLLAFGLGMNEVQSYAFFDESFLKRIKYEPKDTLKIANPQSENWQRLITSLVPNLIKCVDENSSKKDTLNFFEYNRVWFEEDNLPVESIELSGIFYQKKENIDFYEGKALLNKLFDFLKLKVSWRKPVNEVASWYDELKVAEIFHQDRIIGIAGKMSKNMINFIGLGDAFIFEIDASFLLSFKPEIHKFKPGSKYPDVNLDISLFVPLNLKSDDLSLAIEKADDRIRDINLIDFFQKDDWKDKKAVTFSFKISDETKTLEKEEINKVWNSVVKNVEKLGAQVR